VFFHGIVLTTQQRDTLQRLVENQKVISEDAIRERVSDAQRRLSRQASRQDTIEYVKTDSIYWAEIRKENRAQLRAVLTPEQQRQFDRNVITVEGERAKRTWTTNYWW
jgi:hypothetical protein